MGKNAIDSSVVVKNIESKLKELRLSKAEFYSKSGITSATLSNWRSGTYAPSQEKLAAAAEVLGVRAIWLLTEHNDTSAETEKNSIPPGFLPMPEMAQVPLVGRIACGTPILAEQNVEQIVSIPAAWRATFTLMCKGDSMAPRIQDGDLVAVRSQPEVENGEIAAVRIGEEATLKHVYVYPNYIELRPENPEYESIIKIGPDMADVVIEGKAVGLCRGI